MLRRPVFSTQFYDNTSSLYQIVSASWLYNPSIVRLGKEYLFSGRLTWQYNTDCGEMITPRSLFYCNLAAAERTNDLTLFGAFDSETCAVEVFNWSMVNDALTETRLGNIRNWFGGSGWYDTKLISLPNSDESEAEKDDADFNSNEHTVVLTMQKSESLPTTNLADLDIFDPNAIILTQLLYISAVTLPLSRFPSRNISIAVAVYFDSGLADWTTEFVGT